MGLVTAIGGAIGYSAHRKRKATKATVNAQRKAARAEAAFSSYQATKQRQQQLRAVMSNAASARAQAAVAGVSQSSGYAGSMSSNFAQASANLGFGNVQTGIDSQIQQFNQQAYSYQQDANDWGAIGSTVTSLTGLGLNAAKTFATGGAA